MVVGCRHNAGSSLGKPGPGAFYTEETIFHVTIGGEYDVLGLGFFETTLLALVLDDTAKPNWLPSGLFDFSHEALPTGWEFSVFDGIVASGGDRAADHWVAMWGYPDLVRNPRHSDELIERDPAALTIFFRELENERAGRGRS